MELCDDLLNNISCYCNFKEIFLIRQVNKKLSKTKYPNFTNLLSQVINVNYGFTSNHKFAKSLLVIVNNCSYCRIIGSVLLNILNDVKKEYIKNNKFNLQIYVKNIKDQSYVAKYFKKFFPDIRNRCRMRRIKSTNYLVFFNTYFIGKDSKIKIIYSDIDVCEYLKFFEYNSILQNYYFNNKLYINFPEQIYNKINYIDYSEHLNELIGFTPNKNIIDIILNKTLNYYKRGYKTFINKDIFRKLAKNSILEKSNKILYFKNDFCEFPDEFYDYSIDKNYIVFHTQCYVD